MDYKSIGQIFMFFKCTMPRGIHKMGKILLPYSWEILKHPIGWWVGGLVGGAAGEMKNKTK